MGAGMGVYGAIGVVGIVVGLLKEIALLVLIVQGVRLINFIIKNKGLSNISFNKGEANIYKDKIAEEDKISEDISLEDIES